MKVLILNCGSSSVKYQLMESENGEVFAKGIVERIGIRGSRLKHKKEGKSFIIEKDIQNHNQAIELVVNTLLDKEIGVISDIKEIDAVGHRVVHGGEKFSNSVIITEEVKKAIKENFELAPLHNPPNLKGIEAAEELMPNIPQVAVFDTAFHQTIPEFAYLYAIPYELYKKYKIRRYGFHGTSHYYVSRRSAEILGKNVEDLKIISCHLGNGASIAAIKNGKSFDTSMGFTPLEGLVMGTRSGDIDPGVIFFLLENTEMTEAEVYSLLNKKSGFLGLFEESSDSRDIVEAYEKGNLRAKLTLEVWAHRIRKYIAGYAGAMGGVDVVIFTAGIGENCPVSRKLCVEGLDFMGIEIDDKLNEEYNRKEGIISPENSKVKVMVIPTNEELVIAQETVRLVEQNK